MRFIIVGLQKLCKLNLVNNFTYFWIKRILLPNEFFGIKIRYILFNLILSCKIFAGTVIETETLEQFISSPFKNGDIFENGNIIEISNNNTKLIIDSNRTIAGVRVTKDLKEIVISSSSTNNPLNISLGSISGIGAPGTLSIFTNSIINLSGGIVDSKKNLGDYSGLCIIDCKSNNITFNLNAPITLPAQITGAKNTILNINKDTEIAVGWDENPETINIGNKRKFTINTAQPQEIYLANDSQQIKFLSVDSSLNILNSYKINKNIRFVNPLIPTSGITRDDDAVGIFTIESKTTSKINIIGSSVGLDENHRLLEVILGNMNGGSVDSNLYSKSLTIRANANINGNMGGRDSKINLGSHQLTYAGSGNFSGILQMNLAISTLDFQKIGNIKVINGGKLDLAQVDKIQVLMNTKNIEKIKGKEFKIFLEENGGQIINKDKVLVEIIETNTAAKWIYNPLSNSIKIEDSSEDKKNPDELADITPEVVPDEPIITLQPNLINLEENTANVMDNDSNNNIAKLKDSNQVNNCCCTLDDPNLFITQPINSSASLNEININTNLPIMSNIVEFLETVINSGIAYNFTYSILNKLENRIGNLYISAGDTNYSRHGIWVSGIYSKIDQKQTNSIHQYKSNIYGIIEGIDREFEKINTYIGVALSYVNNNTKFKSKYYPQKLKADSYGISLYSLTEFSNNSFVQTIANLSKHKIHNISTINLSNQNFVLRNSHNATSGFFEILTGYKQAVSNQDDKFLFVVLPMTGVNYSRFIENAYNIKPILSQDIRIKKLKQERLELIFGGKILSSYKTSSKLINPEIHSFIRYNILDRKYKVKTSNSQLLVHNIKHNKLNSLLLNLGFGLGVQYNRLEYHIDYDLFYAHKYISNQGIIKIKILL